MLRDVVVVGASLAGLRAAETLRTDGFDGRLAVVGAEAHLPYDRPPLSKKVLAGEWEPDRIHLRKPDEYDDLGFDLHLGVKAVGLDPAARQVRLSDGSALAFDGLVIATGAAPRRLPGQPELPGIFELRTLDDSLALRRALVEGPRRVVVVGAGFIGAEVAATARSRGLEVTLVEALPVPLARGLGPALGAAIGELHRARGVDVRLGVGVEAMEGSERVERIRLTDGTVLEADVVVVGVGRRAGDGLAGRQRSGAPRRRGVRRHPGGRASGRLRRRRPGPVAQRAVRRGDARRALDQRCRAGRGRGAQPAGHGRGRHAARPTPRCRSSGATSSTPASSSSDGPEATTTSRWCTAPSTAASSWPSTGGRAGFEACSASAARSS